MKAKYYRYLFHGVANGLCYSGCISDQMKEEEEGLCFLYLAGGEEWDPQEAGDSYAAPEIRYQFLILADFSKSATERAKRVLARGRVATVFCPQPENDRESALLNTLIDTVGLKSEQAGVTAVYPVRETLDFCLCREQFYLIPVTRDDRTSLALYHADADGTPQTEECILCMKPALPEYPCSSMVDTATFACDLRCAYNNDIELCKRHNRKEQKAFLDGHLLLGGIAGGDVLEELFSGELKEQKERIRLFGFLDDALQRSDIEKMNQLEHPGFATWYVGAGEMGAQNIREIAVGCPGRSYVSVGETGGLCASGYYIQRRPET